MDDYLEGNQINIVRSILLAHGGNTFHSFGVLFNKIEAASKTFCSCVSVVILNHSSSTALLASIND
jgi:hypothetical protein